MKKMNSVVHFELPAQNRQRVADFYTQAFGWKAQMLGEEMGNYVLVSTTDTDEQGMIKNPGAINGGIYPVTPDMPPQHPSLVLSVDNIQEAMDNIRAAGGEVLGEPQEIPGYGLYVAFKDTEGNRNSLMEPFMKM